MRRLALLLVLSSMGVLLAPAQVSARTLENEPTHWALAWIAPLSFYPSVMASDAAGTVVAGYDGDLVALELAGNQQWAAPTGLEEIVNQPALVSNVVLVPGRHGLVALDRTTGTQLWMADLDGARLTSGSFGGRPIVVATTPDGALRTIDPSSGAELMQRTLPSPKPEGAPPVQVTDEIAIVAWGVEGNCCTIAGFDVADGRMRWKRAVDQRSTEPVAHEGLVILGVNRSTGARGRIVAFDATTGALRWRTPVRGRFVPALHGDAAHDLVVVPSRDGSVIAADVESGAIQWVSEATIPADSADPKITPGQVFLTPHSTDLVAFDRETGEVVSRGPIEQAIVVTYTDVVDEHFQLLVTNGLEGEVWNFEPDGLST